MPSIRMIITIAVICLAVNWLVNRTPALSSLVKAG